MKNFGDISNKDCNKIKSINDIIEKQCGLGKNEINNVMSILKHNNFINNMGVINGKKIFGDEYNQINDIPLKVISEFENCVDYIDQSEKVIKNITSNIQTNINKNTTDIIEQGSNIINLKNNLENNFNQILPLDNINFGKYNDKKEEIIKCLGKMRTKIDGFKIEEKCEEIIEQLRSRFINEITNFILQALNADGLKSFLGDIQNNYRKALDTVSQELKI